MIKDRVLFVIGTVIIVSIFGIVPIIVLILQFQMAVLFGLWALLFTVQMLLIFIYSNRNKPDSLVAYNLRIIAIAVAFASGILIIWAAYQFALLAGL